jgi:hypothetical protein
VPSGPFTDTLGSSALATLFTGGETTPGFLAPGGTYALVPRTTAPYLNVGQTVSDRRTRARGTTELVFLVHTAIIDVIDVPLFSNVRVTRSGLST